MLNVANVSIHFGGKYIFDGVSFTLRPNDRIGLIGRNGAGKSTLLKIICGLEFPESGNIAKPNDYTIGYLPQDMKVESELSVLEEASHAMEELKYIEKSIPEISAQIAERSDYESDDYARLVQKLSELNDRFEILGGGSARAKIEKVLKGLGFSDEDMHRPVNTFSGGWQMRLELAKILLKSPDLIMLDEPTNHLDIESIRWLENFLKNYFGSVMIVSHDKRFLDNITNRTIEIFSGKTYDMNLPFSKFLEAREEQRQQQQAAYRNQQRKIAQTEKFIERFRYKATLATRVQSRVKQLDKLDRIELEEEDNSAIRFRFPEPPRSGRVAVEMKKLSKSYGDKLVLKDIDFVVERSEKIAFVGKNGEGKTTLSKIIAGEEPYDGDMIPGHNVEISYYAQHQAQMLYGDKTVFQTIDDIATGDMRSKVRSLLGAFLFSGEDVDKKVKVLSGGEKSRLALAKLLLQPSNLLVLDEPTNHLDIRAKEVLKDALKNYDGALVIVSHDRDFLQGLTNKTVEFKNKQIREYDGDIEDFLRKLDIEQLNTLEEKKKNTADNKANTNPGSAKADRELQKAWQRDLNRVKKKISKVEEYITEFEEKISRMDDFFASPEASDIEKMNEMTKEYNDLKSGLEQKMTEWEELTIEMEEVESQKP